MRTRAFQTWSRLDNAGKLFASTSDNNDPMVFRFACALTEDVDPEFLQEAMEQTLREFPIFRSILRRGLFWYYFEDSALDAYVQPENLPPCSTLYNRMRKTLLFRVTYYKKRINLEAYHALTDGTGALQFIKTLVYHYLILAHAEDFGDTPPLLDIDASNFERADDSFDKYYTGKRGHVNIKNPRAYRLRGPTFSDARIRIFSGQLSVTALLDLVRRYHTTMSVFITSVLICAIHGEMASRDRKRPIIITIPVNLRKYFESESVRNFFGTFNVGHQSNSDTLPLDELIPIIAAQFKKELQPEQLAVRMQGMTAIEHNPFARIAPLFFKDLIIKKGHDLSERGVTACVSNVGKIEMPPEFSPYIDLFDVFISTKRMQLCMCSYQDNLILGLTAPFLSTNIQKRFFRILSSLGLDITIRSNLIDGVDFYSQDETKKNRRGKKQKKGKMAKEASPDALL